MDIQKLISSPFARLAADGPREATMKEKIAALAFLSLSIFQNMKYEYQEMQEAVKRSYEKEKSLAVLKDNWNAYQDWQEGVNRLIKFAPKAKTAESSAIEFPQFSGSGLFLEASSIVRNPGYTPSEKLDRLKKLPLAQFGISPSRFTSQVYRQFPRR